MTMVTIILVMLITLRPAIIKRQLFDLLSIHPSPGDAPDCNDCQI